MLALACMVFIMQVKGKNMAALLFLLSLVLYSAAPVHPHPQGVVYREADITNSRQVVSLGGLFIFRHYNKFGRCSEKIQPQSIERAEAMVFAIRQINRDPYLLPGVNLTFDIRETCYAALVALENANEYLQSRDASRTNQTVVAVSGVVGASTSYISHLLNVQMFRLSQLPHISYASTAAHLSAKPRYDYFFRTVPSDSLQARAMADIIAHFNWTFVIALFSDDIYGREGIDALNAALESQNDMCQICVAEIPLPYRSSNNQVYDDIIGSMSQEWVRNASVAVFFGYDDQAIGIIHAIIRDSTTHKLLQGITWIASKELPPSLPQEYYHVLKGMINLVPPNRKNREDFTRYFISLSPENNKTDNPWFDRYWEAVFNCSLQGDNLCNISSQNLSMIRKPIYTSYVIDAVYAFAHAIHQMIVDNCLNNTICDKIIIRRSTGEAINGSLLRQYLFNVSFNSTSFGTEKKLFDANGDVQGSYLIMNLQNINNSYSLERVGTWDQNLLEWTAPLQWPGDREDPPQSVCSLPCPVGHEPQRVPNQEQCCWECKSCPGENTASSGEECYECENKTMPNPERSGCIAIPLTFFTPPSPWAVIILLLTCAGIATTVFVAGMFVTFHKKKVIKASSRELSAILLGGILLCYILPFLFVGKPSPALCGVRRFAIGFCFAFSYSALLVRSNRIHRIFNHSHVSSISPRFIGPVSQVVITCLLISIQVLLALVWLAAEPPSVETVQPNSRTLELRCGESPYFGLPVSLCYSLFLLVLSTYFAFLTRKVPDNFNEAKFINATVYSLCIIWLGFLPAYFVSIQFGTVYESFFLLLAIILSASVTLLCLLVPKIFIVILDKGEEKKDWTTRTGTETAISTQASST